MDLFKFATEKETLYFVMKWTYVRGIFGKWRARRYINRDFADLKSKYPLLEFEEMQYIYRPKMSECISLLDQKKYRMPSTDAIKVQIKNIEIYPELKNYAIDGNIRFEGF